MTDSKRQIFIPKNGVERRFSSFSIIELEQTPGFINNRLEYAL